MAFRVTKVGDDLYEAVCSPPHGQTWLHPKGRVWRTRQPLTLNQLVKAGRRLRIHVQDFWDAVVEADPSVAEGIR